MFSLIRTGTCWRPLCTAMVRPTISGRIIERRDHVLIGLRLFVATASCTFFARCGSTKGPLCTERGTLSYLHLSRLLRLAAANDHVVSALVLARLVALRRHAPRSNRVLAEVTALATTVRVIDRVHGRTTNRRTNTAPALRTGLAELPQAVLAVADFADRGAAVNVNPAHLTRAQTHCCVTAFASHQL